MGFRQMVFFGAGALQWELGRTMLFAVPRMLATRFFFWLERDRINFIVHGVYDYTCTFFLPSHILNNSESCFVLKHHYS